MGGISQHKHAIELDMGIESGQAMSVDVAEAQEIATDVHPYADGVIDKVLPGTDTQGRI